MPRKTAVTISALSLIAIAVAFTYSIKYYESTLEKSIARLEDRELQEINTLRNIKFEYLSSELDRSMFEAKLITETKIKEIETELLKIPNLKYWFDNFHLDNNPVVNILRSSIVGVFYNRPTDSNDPFIIIVNIDGVPILAVDLSEECAVLTEDGVPQRTRTFLEEYPMHANISLAKSTFPRIANHSAYGLKNPLFFQFQGDMINGVKVAQPISTFNLAGIKDLYMRYNGDWRKTFKYYEFQIPSYLYDDRDILGQPRVSRGVLNDDIKIIIYTLSYKFIDYIETRPRVVETLAKYDEMENSISINYEGEKNAICDQIQAFKLISLLLNITIAIGIMLIMYVLRDE